MCKESDCEKPSVTKARGWCAMHDKRWRLYGNVNATPRFARDPVLRFWSYVNADGVCWEWTGVIKPSGYGKFTYGRRVTGERRDANAHRYAWELLVGPIPPGMQIDHLCRNRRCVMPDHMQVVTPGENTRRGVPARKIHCKRGHRLAGRNLYVQPSTGRRSCMTCRRWHKERLKAEAVAA